MPSTYHRPVVEMKVTAIACVAMMEKIGNAGGIFNLMRNFGGIGISVSTTFLARMTQAQRANLVGSTTPHDPRLPAAAGATDGGNELLVGGSPGANAGLRLLNEILMQQSNLKAHVDRFYWTALIGGVASV